MELGQLVDYCIEWNNLHESEEDETGSGKPKQTKRKATQADWDALFGR